MHSEVWLLSNRDHKVKIGDPNKQTDKQTNRQTDKQTNIQTYKHPNRQTDKQTTRNYNLKMLFTHSF